MTAPYDHVIAANSWLFDIIAQRTIRERIAAEFHVPRHMVRLAALDVLFALRENPSKEEARARRGALARVCPQVVRLIGRYAATTPNFEIWR